MPLDDALNGSQSYAGAFKLSRPMQTLKHTEKLIDILHVEARTVVPYEHLYFTLAVGAADLDLGSRSHPCELNGIRDQVDEDEFQHGTVAMAHRKGADFPANVTPARLLPEFGDDFANKLCEVYSCLAGLDAPDPRKAQQVVDQVGHFFCRFQDPLRVPLTLVIEERRGLFLQQLCVADDMPKRRPQVVGRRV